MGCDAEAAGVRDALPVNHQQIRLYGQAGKGLDQGRDFTKRQQARYVGEYGRRDGPHAHDDIPALRVEQNDIGAGKIGFYIVADIYARDRAYIAEAVFEDDLIA